MSAPYYLDKLYPLQDKVMKIFSQGKVKHYLTGGTVLSRFCFQHRYSDDLDFFMNHDPDFEKESDRAISLLSTIFADVKIENRQEFYRRVFVTQGDVKLKLDFVNDVEFHSGGFNENSYYHRLDNPVNILSNKVSALSRQQAKDIADIIWICKNHAFNWRTIIDDAAQKDDWINEVDVLTKLKTFDTKKLLDDINWVSLPDTAKLAAELNNICFDIASANDNSLNRIV